LAISEQQMDSSPTKNVIFGNFSSPAAMGQVPVAGHVAATLVAASSFDLQSAPPFHYHEKVAARTNAKFTNNHSRNHKARLACSPNKTSMRNLVTFLYFLLGLTSTPANAVLTDGCNDIRDVGIAKVDITPEHPVRLSGYGSRREETSEVEQRIWAKAIAIGNDQEGPAILITVDNCGVPDSMRTELVSRLTKKASVQAERFAICFSHTHCAPCLTGALVNIFSTDIPLDHQVNIDRYTQTLTDNLERVSLAALADRKPSRLSWAVGNVSFARNRRAWGGPVDHSLPVMFVFDLEDRLRAVFANYACHATTLSFNKIHGDWPGTAMEAIEREHPGVTALIGIGCGADQNPHPRSTVELAIAHGAAVAAEVSRLIQFKKTPICGTLEARATDISLPYDPLPSRDALEKDATSPTPQVAYVAKKNLARIKSGEKLPNELPYRVQVWNFGDDLAMIFLPGEVTVDYQLRLKVEFDTTRLWVNAYSNDAPCYIPSARVLTEGGYEGMTAMVFYDRPSKFASGIEDRILNAVRQSTPKQFLATYRADVPPKSPSDALTSIKTKKGLVVELACAEPFVADPVAIDWDTRGRMWVVEQPDYPNGIDGNWKPGGRVKILTDTDGDTRYDKSILFMQDLPFPTGITCWGHGAFVCAAPDILYAEDTDGDGMADKIEKMFTGFYTDNYNARINSLALGLDNWIHGANGNLGGKIRSEKTGEVLDIAGRDIRFNPETGVLQLVSGVTQQGRARDDFDNWFGCSNSRWIFHFPLQDRYLRRNPHVIAPPPTVYIPAGKNVSALNPISQSLERFNNPHSLGHVTAANGLGIYRDTLLGSEYAGNAFVGEVAHNLVRRYRLDPKGATYEAYRPDDEAETEFLASKDNWTRPVQVRTGPDGALYMVDMYRAVIEHTRWIPADRLAKIDPRAGDTMGRIYRIVPSGAKLRAVRDLTKLSPHELVAAMDSPNGTVRDLVHQILLRQSDDPTRNSVAKLAASSKLPAVRVQALSILDGIDGLSNSVLLHALGDIAPEVRRHAIRLCEARLQSDSDLAKACCKLVDDPDFGVRYQLALSLGEWNDASAASVLGEMATKESHDLWFRAAIVSSSVNHPIDVLDSVLKTNSGEEGKSTLIGQLIATAAAIAKDGNDFDRLLALITQEKEPQTRAPNTTIPAMWKIAGMGVLQDAIDKRKISLSTLAGSARAQYLFDSARKIATAEKARDADREASIRLLGRGLNDMAVDLPILIEFLQPVVSDRLQKAAMAMLARSSDSQVSRSLLSDWSQRTPSLRTPIINMLLSRTEWTLSLLDAIEAGKVQSADVAAASRQSLAEHKDSSIRARSQKLFPQRNAAERGKILEAYQVVAALRGDGVKGADVFRNKCATCHSYIGAGFAVGPDLKAFYNKSVSDFVTAILDPNAAVEPRYANYVVLTNDDRTLTGVITNETASHFELVQPNGVRESILRADNPEIRATGLSLMPEGLEQAITPQDMADLIAFLKSGG
jgi:putative membrane-bound dehydrogenase-like protein